MIVSRASKIIATVIFVGAIVGAVVITVLRINNYLVVMDEQTGSMAPRITPGAAVIMIPEPANTVKIGQVIATVPPPPFPQEIVLHEVAAIRDAAGRRIVTTRGIANKVNDPWNVTLGNRVYHEVFVIPAIGGIASSTLAAPGLIMIFVAAIIVAAGVFYVWRELQIESKTQGDKCVQT